MYSSLAQVVKDKEALQEIMCLSYNSAFEVCYPKQIPKTDANFQSRSKTKAQPQNSKPCNYYEEIKNYVSDNLQRQ